MRPTARLIAACLLAALAAGTNPATAQDRQVSMFQPALTVNDEPVTWYDIDQRMRLLEFSGVRGGDDLQDVALDQLIEDRLKRQAGARIGVRATSFDGDALVASFAEANNVPEDRINAALRATGTARQTLIEALSADAVWRQVIRSRFGRLAEPSEIEVDQAVTLAMTGRNMEYLLAEIVIPTARRGETETRILAERLSQELSAGGDFAAAALRYSGSVSAREGGAIGWLPESALPPPVSDALAETPRGRVTPPIPVQGAIALLKVIDSRQIDVADTGGVSLALMAISARDADPIAAMARLDSVIAQNPSCETGEALAAAAGLTAERGSPQQVATLPEQVRSAVAQRAVGEIGGPIQMQGSAVAFIVCERLEGVPADLRDRIREQVRQDRFQRFANSFLQELRNDAVIEQR